MNQNNTLTLEDRIDKAQEIYLQRRWINIDFVPHVRIAISIKEWEADVLNSSYVPHITSNRHQVNKIIEQANLTECLTSPSAYIREYRRKYEQSK